MSEKSYLRGGADFLGDALFYGGVTYEEHLSLKKSIAVSGTATFDGEINGNKGLIVSTTNRAGLQVVLMTNVGAERGIEFQTSRPSAHGDLAGTISWNSNDGAAAAISAEILGNAGDATVPGRITISTGADYGKSD